MYQDMSRCTKILVPKYKGNQINLKIDIYGCHLSFIIIHNLKIVVNCKNNSTKVDLYYSYSSILFTIYSIIFEYFFFNPNIIIILQF